MSQSIGHGVGLEEETPQGDGTSMVRRADPRRLPVGAEVLPGGGVEFRVWAPRRRKVAVILQSGPEGPSDKDSTTINLKVEFDGYFEGIVPEARPGTLYRYQLDG